MTDEPPVSQYAQGNYIAQATHGGTATVQVVLPPLPVQEQNRVRFLKRLRYQYDELWEQSFQGTTLMTLGLVKKPDAVLHHTSLLFLPPQQPERPLPPGTSIAQVYDESGQELLILGEPGAGKSTLLLDLARQLVGRAEQDAGHPLPIILALSSWAEKRPPITEWLAEQLSLLYDVPHNICHAWVQTNQILPLLDGLDEVAQEVRVACIDAITTYRKEHLISLVVSSRRAEYEEIARQKRLPLHSAVVVQPLTRQQVDTYLVQAGPSLAAVRTVLHTNPMLQELTTTPLMLSVLTLAYHGKTIEDGLLAGSAPEVQQQVFATYVQRMLQSRGRENRYTPEQTVQWLAWLARQLAQHSQTEFYLERMQPSWIPTSQLHWLYELLAIRVPDMLIGACVSLVFVSLSFSASLGVFDVLHYGVFGGLIGWLISRGGQPPENGFHFWSSFWRNLLSIRSLGTGLLIGLSFGLFYGLNFHSPGDGLAYGLSFGLMSDLLSATLGAIISARSPAKNTVWSWGNPWYKLIKSGYLTIGLSTGLSYALGYVLSTESAHLLDNRPKDVIVLAYALAYVLIYTLVGILLCVILRGRRPGIRPADIVNWSWRSSWHSLTSIRHLGNGLAVGLLIGVIVGVSAGLLQENLSFGLSFGRSAALFFGLSYWLLLGLFRGLSNDTLDEHDRIRPNEGIRRSARNGLLVGLISGLVSWLFCSLYYALGFLFIYGVGPALGVGLSVGGGIGLLVGLSVGLLCGLPNGGLAYVEHCVLRLLLWQARCINWNIPNFLDYAAGRILLRKVGGGYMFIHRLLLEYFASVDTASASSEE